MRISPLIVFKSLLLIYKKEDLPDFEFISGKETLSTHSKDPVKAVKE